MPGRKSSRSAPFSTRWHGERRGRKEPRQSDRRDMASDPKSSQTEKRRQRHEHIGKQSGEGSDERWQSAGDLRRELMWIAHGNARAVVRRLSRVLPCVGKHAAIWARAAWVVSGLWVGGGMESRTDRRAATASIRKSPLRRDVLLRMREPLGLSAKATPGHVGFAKRGSQLYRHRWSMEDVPILVTEWRAQCGLSAVRFAAAIGRFLSAAH